jgi:hypothetical protein
LRYEILFHLLCLALAHTGAFIEDAANAGRAFDRTCRDFLAVEGLLGRKPLAVRLSGQTIMTHDY